MEIEGGDSKWERETVIQMSDGEPGLMRVWTAQRRVGTWLEKICGENSLQIKRGTNRDTWDAIIPSKYLKLRSTLKKPKTLSASQREAMMANLAKGRQARAEKEKS